MSQSVCRKTLGASYGDAFLAALAMGDVAKKDTLTWNPEERRIQPDKGTAKIYARQYRRFQGALQPF